MPASQFTQQDINDSLVSYEHNGSETVADSFDFTVDDGQGVATPGTFSITITPVNDEQVLATNAGLTIDQGSVAVITSAMLEMTDVDVFARGPSVHDQRGVLARNNPGQWHARCMILSARDKCGCGELSERWHGKLDRQF